MVPLVHGWTPCKRFIIVFVGLCAMVTLLVVEKATRNNELCLNLHGVNSTGHGFL